MTAAALPELSSPAAMRAAGWPWRGVALAGLALILSAAFWFAPAALSAEGRVTLIVTALAVIGWVGTRIPESIVALSAALALVLFGAVPETRLFETLGSDLVWLLLAAFVIAAVLKDSGLADRLAAPLTRRRPGFAALTGLLTVTIAATAFVLPSTSGRAALLLPVFLALVPLLPDPRMNRALALLFPTVILLSAGGSLIGAGAHLVAVEAIAGAGGPRLGYLDWLTLGAPLGLLSSGVGAALILLLFVPRALWRAPVLAAPPPAAPDARQKRVAALVLALVVLWAGEAWHGIDMTLVAVLGAVALLTPPFTAKKTKEIFRAVDIELILYMAATMLIAQAMVDSGADRWLAALALAALPADVAGNGVVAVAVLSVVAVMAHLFIASRSARAAVLIPAVALPMAGMGHDATLMILVAVMGTGFCQTMMASAKPVAIYGLREEAGFGQADLFRLAVWLAPVKMLLLAGFALAIWPQQLAGMRAIAPAASLAAAASETGALTVRAPEMPDPAPAAFAALPAVGPEPPPRPAALPQGAAAGKPPARERKAASGRRSLGAQIGQDFRSAGRQIGRGLKQIFR